jgi:hypothetical protein
VVAAACWAIYQHVVVPILPFDDAFITYRYVENFVHGYGLTYNSPIRAWGYTSPLHVFWLALWRFVLPGVDVTVIAVRGNAVFVVAAGLAALQLLRRYTGDIVIAVAGCCLLMIHPAFLAVSTGGMESALFVALVLWTLHALSSDRPWRAGVLWGLAFLARPEAVALLPVFALLYWRTWKRGLAAAIAASCLVGPWLIFTLLYYHSVSPLSVIAKNRPLYPLPLGHALTTIGAFTAPAIFGPTAFANSDIAVWAAVIILVLAGLFAVVSTPLRQRQAWAPAVFAACLVVLYGVGNPMFFEWYWPILLGAFLLMLVIASAGIGLAGAGNVAAYGLLACIAGVVLSSYWDNAGGHAKSVRYVAEDATRLRTITYEAIGRKLNALAKPGDTVAAPEIGALGYAYHGTLIDACGLVSPEAIPYLPVPAHERLDPTIGVISVELVQATTPAWVVTMPIFAERSLLASKWFSERYELTDTVPLPKVCFDCANVLVFKRR